ncbi:MAG: hypothetical protein GY838_18410 [bacterium]|nr:hypothetical protein [bacterium]
MKKVIIALFALLLIVPAGAFAQATSNIGLYTTPDPAKPLGIESQVSLIAPGSGLYDIYLVCTDPTNENTGLPIENVGGFELSLTLPPGWLFNGVAYAEGVLDLDAAAEHFYCSGSIPVVGGNALLATITLLTFDGTAGPIHMAPYFAAPSIPGSIAITDADDAFSLSHAYPSSGNFDDPVFGLNMVVVPTEDVSWGDVKSLFQ